METKLSFKVAKVKKKPNGASSITILGQPYKGIHVSISEKELSLVGSDSDSIAKELGNKQINPEDSKQVK